MKGRKDKGKGKASDHRKYLVEKAGPTSTSGIPFPPSLLRFFANQPHATSSSTNAQATERISAQLLKEKEAEWKKTGKIIPAITNPVWVARSDGKARNENGEQEDTLVWRIPDGPRVEGLSRLPLDVELALEELYQDGPKLVDEKTNVLFESRAIPRIPDTNKDAQSTSASSANASTTHQPTKLTFKRYHLVSTTSRSGT